ncbi:HAD family hydrolase [Patescibacteria group bacterium]
MKIPDWVREMRAIGWDLDGTLYAPNSIPSEVISEMQFKAVMEANEWDREMAEEEFKEKYSELGSHTKTLTALNVDGPGFFQKLWDELPLEDYIRHDSKITEIFSRLSRHRHFMVTNSNTMEQVERKLKLVGVLPSVFEKIVTTDKLDKVKPDPQPFMEALNAMALQPKNAVFVGDRLTTDIRGARNVGMKSCMVWGQSPEADLSLPTVYDVVNYFL